MGVLPADTVPGPGHAEFSRDTGPVMLTPAITHETFTLCFWIRPEFNRPWHLLEQQSPEARWILKSGSNPATITLDDDLTEGAGWTEEIRMEVGAWQHIAVARRADGTSVLWRNGVRQIDGRRAWAWPGASRWLAVGGLVRGGQPFVGGLSDLCVFDRVLTDAETSALFATGRETRPAKGSRARSEAQERPVARSPVREATPSSAQQWRHRQFTTEDGLPGNSVHAILQARDGFLWVGTEAGLARFDGRDFRTFTARNSPALAATGPNIITLAEAGDGTIWAGSFGGLLRVRGREVTAFTNGLPQRFITRVQPLEDGSLWVAGFNHTLPRGPCILRRYHPETGTSSIEVALPGHLRRWSATVDGVWLAMEDPAQILFWDGRSDHAKVIAKISGTPLQIRFANRPELPPDTEVLSWQEGPLAWAEVRLGTRGPAIPWTWNRRGVHVGRDEAPAEPGNRWIGVSYELARIRGTALETVLPPTRSGSSEIECLLSTSDAGVWFGTDEDGLHYVEEKLVRVFTPEDGLSGHNVRSVSVGANDELWVGTSEGLSRWEAGRWSTERKGRFGVVRALHPGEAWFGLTAEEPAVIGREIRDRTDSMVLVEGVNWNHPNAMRFDRTGALWVACQQGVSRLDPKAVRRLPASVGSWILPRAGQGRGFQRFERGQELPDAQPCGLVEDAEGAIWVGSLGGGLSRIADGKVHTMSGTNGLPHPISVPVHLDRSGSLWIATPDGLARWVGGRFEILAVGGGWPQDTPLDAIEDDLGNLWVSGRQGIHRLALAELEDYFSGRIAKVRALTLGLRDGLLTPECSILRYPSMAKTTDGLIWVATRNGLARFDPKRIKLNLQPPRSTIERILANRKEIQLPASGQPARILELAPGSGRQLEVHYAAINLLHADRVQYRYRLEGHDTDWQPPTELRAAFYTNLRPGQYRFRLKAANAHGLWNEVESVLSFAILPHFWETRTFLGLTTALLAGLAVWVHRHRLASQRRLQAMQHRESLMSEKARIAADMHDELGAALTQIAILGEVAQRQTADEAKARSTLQRISQAARDVTATMSELVWATHPLNDTLDNLVARLRERAATQLEDSGIAMHLDFPDTVPARNVSAIFRRNLVLILKESLTNVIKHARASRVEVMLTIRRNALVLRIVDDGCSGDQEGQGHGLANMRRRAEELGGRFQRTSAPGSGWLIEIEVPFDPPGS